MHPTNLRNLATRLIPRLALLRVALAGLFVLLVGGPAAWGVDPLPADIEQASPEVQAHYLDRINRQSMEEKLSVGKRRHQERVHARQQLHHFMEAEVAKREHQVRMASLTPKAHNSTASFVRLAGILLGVGLGFTLFIRAWRHTSVA